MNGLRRNEDAMKTNAGSLKMFKREPAARLKIIFTARGSLLTAQSFLYATELFQNCFQKSC